MIAVSPAFIHTPTTTTTTTATTTTGCVAVFLMDMFFSAVEEEEERLFRCRVFYTRKKTPRDKKGGGHVQQSTMDGWIVVGEREREMDD
jgi:hypothetical protein